MKRFIAIFILAALLLCGCGEKAEEAEQTTLSGIVVSVDGTKVELVSADTMTGGSRPSRGEGEETRPEGDFTMPEGDFTMPEGFEGGRPGFGGQRPEGAEGEMPTMPEGEMPTMPEGGGDRFNMEGVETTTVELKDAHISLELEDGSKAAGSMSDITVGSRLTVTMEGDKAVRVLVSQSSFGGGNMPNFGAQGGDRGNFGNRDQRPNREQATPTDPAA